MNQTIFISICSLFYCILLIVLLIKSKDKNNAEIKILKVLTIINFLTLLCETSGSYLGANYEKHELINSLVLKGMVMLYASWFSFFILFTRNISKKENTIIIKKDNVYIFIMALLSAAITLVLPIVYNVNDAGAIIYTSGMTVDFLRVYTLLCEGLCLLIMFKNIKKIKATKYTSLFVLISICTLSAVIQTYYPSLLLVASTETFVLYVAYISMLRNQNKEQEVVKK